MESNKEEGQEEIKITVNRVPCYFSLKKYSLLHPKPIYLAYRTMKVAMNPSCHVIHKSEARIESSCKIKLWLKQNCILVHVYLYYCNLSGKDKRYHHMDFKIEFGDSLVLPLKQHFSILGTTGYLEFKPQFIFYKRKPKEPEFPLQKKVSVDGASVSVDKTEKIITEAINAEDQPRWLSSEDGKAESEKQADRGKETEETQEQKADSVIFEGETKANKGIPIIINLISDEEDEE